MVAALRRRRQAPPTIIKARRRQAPPTIIKHATRQVSGRAGVASRRAAEEIIRAGRVTVGATAVTDPARDVSDEDRRARWLTDRARADARVYAVNKPAGVVSTARDPQRRPTVVSLVPTTARLYPVGRLDADTTGLILLTNDGELAHRLTHPSFEVPKTYRAHVAHPPVRDKALAALRDGVELDDGRTAPARVRRLAAMRSRSRSTKAASDRSGGCARPSGTRSSCSSASRSGRCGSAPWHPAAIGGSAPPRSRRSAALDQQAVVPQRRRHQRPRRPRAGSGSRGGRRPAAGS